MPSLLALLLATSRVLSNIVVACLPDQQQPQQDSTFASRQANCPHCSCPSPRPTTISPPTKLSPVSPVRSTPTPIRTVTNTVVAGHSNQQQSRFLPSNTDDQRQTVTVTNTDFFNRTESPFRTFFPVISDNNGPLSIPNKQNKTFIYEPTPSSRTGTVTNRHRHRPKPPSALSAFPSFT